LYDVIDENGNGNISLRPNQFFAVSLPFALIEAKYGRGCFKMRKKNYIHRSVCEVCPGMIKDMWMSMVAMFTKGIHVITRALYGE
jgi:hypothetical protein